MNFGLACLKEKWDSRILYFVRLQNNIHDLLVMFEKQDIPIKLQGRNRSLNTKVTKSHSMLSLNHKVIVT